MKRKEFLIAPAKAATLAGTEKKRKTQHGGLSLFQSAIGE